MTQETSDLDKAIATHAKYYILSIKKGFYIK